MEQLTKNEKIMEYLKGNVETIRELVQECNSWNGSLEDYDYYENGDYFFNMFFENNPQEAVRASYYGEYNYMDDYVRFNAYGNLKSVSEWEYEAELTDGVEEIFETWFELYEEGNVETYDEGLKELLEEE